jgi:hypothetical protein
MGSLCYPARAVSALLARSLGGQACAVAQNSKVLDGLGHAA